MTLSLFLAAAFAQAPPDGGFDAHGFRMAALDADIRDPLVVTRPGAFDGKSWFAGGLLEYASQPLVFERAGVRTVELDDLVAANLSVGFAPVDRIRLDVAVPLFLYGDGLTETTGAGLGDIRASGLLALVRPTDGGLGAALVGNIDLPTGRPEVYLGNAGVGGGIGLAVTAEGERVTATGTVGTQLRPNTLSDVRPAPTKGGDAFTWGAALGYVVSDETGITLEAHGEVFADPDVRAAVGTPIETLLSVRHVRENGGFLTAGLGTAITPGAGASPLRILVGGGFGSGREKRVPDIDGDGILDNDDRCPATPENLNGYLDTDGCPDTFPVLEFRALGLGGNPRPEAVIEVSGPKAASGTGSVTIEGTEVMPGTEWRAVAKIGACLEGVQTHTLGERSAVVDVPLKHKRTATLRVEVTDKDGKPITNNVKVRLRTEEAACVPKSFDGFKDGVGEVPVGPGSHFAFVSADGYAIHQESFEIAADGTVVIKAQLQAALAQLDTSQPGKTVIKILDRVYFDTGRATIQARSHQLLDQVAVVINSNEIAKLEIGGHTDSQGSDTKNLTLSQERADAVMAYLVGKGIKPELLLAKGYGESVPVADNKTSEGRANNRRVEFNVVTAPK